MDPTIVALAKAYAYRLEKGKTPQEAEQYVLSHIAGATPANVALAIVQANQALSVGFNMQQLPLHAKLSDALLGTEEPAPTVAVRVDIIRDLGDTSPTGARVNRHNTVYISMRWDQTVEDVLDAVDQYIQVNWHDSGDTLSPIAFVFKGASLWPLI